MNEPDSLDRALDVSLVADGRYALDVLDGWAQGRGAFGGLVLGAMLRAVTRAEPDPARRVRSVTGEIPAPVLPGLAEITVQPLRRGANVSTWRATMTQQGEVVAQLVAVLGAARPITPRWVTLTPPDARWQDAPVLPFIEGVTPVFSRAFEYRALPPFPYSAADDAVVQGWVRPRAPAAVRDAGYLAALADAFWPALLVRAEAPRATATIAFSLQIVGAPTITDEPLCFRAAAPVLDEGYSVEFRELWTPAGELVALNQQTFVVMR